MKTKAAILLDVPENTLKEFTVTEPYSNDVLTGVICRQSDYRYGAMVLFKVNDWDCEQIIYGTPKMHYPFDKNGNFNWPKIVELEAWEKLDGTNILLYWYEYKTKLRFSFKTRLTPVLGQSKFGDFLGLWNEVFFPRSNQCICDFVEANAGYNLSFELCGYRNPITVKYTFPLRAVFLFGINRLSHTVKPPSQFKRPYSLELPMEFTIKKNSTPTEIYESLKETSHLMNNTGELYSEGMVLYALTNEDKWRQIKCKPDEITKIHWASSAIPKIELWNTAINSFESGNTLENFIALLQEEYTETQIGTSRVRIKSTFEEAKKHLEFMKRVNETWGSVKKEGFDVKTDKAAAFRYLSKFFSGSEMRKVAAIIFRREGINE